MSPRTSGVDGGSTSDRRTTRRQGRTRELNREEILRVAADLFRVSGYHATNLQAVADVFGVQRPAIYYYFESKAEILKEIHNRLMSDLRRQLDETTALDIGPAEKLARVLEQQVRTYAQRTSDLAVFTQNEVELPKPVLRQIRREKREYQDLLEGLYRDGVAAGELVDMDPKIAIYALIGMTSFMYRWYDPRGTYSAEEIAGMFLRVAQDGIRP